MGDQPNGDDRSLTLNDLVVLALLAEGPSHGFAVARLLAPDGDLGRILTMRRPQVYRAIDRLQAAGLVEPQATEPGDAGPRRTVYRVSAAAREPLERWLAEPVAHVRDLRVEFLAKLRLLERAGRRPDDLVAAQREVLAPTLDRLADPGPDPAPDSDVGAGGAPGAGDVVDRWRAVNAEAARRFLEAWPDSG